ncbi:hypothetical protein [Demequina mangrovi]|uniref:TspO and MBR related proteins n=1 Tax=Demequina mangrovi TaxID=1043493 RepID=A0A1H6UHF7_9MICO|nr:hypothetical protein [Demequina mangrovi]SEI89197.1 TspO and MBR related proteins [Demequina mangrovi]
MTVAAEQRITAGDMIARGLVLAATLLAILGTAWGTGSFGGMPVDEAVDGALAPESTFVAMPASADAMRTAVLIGLALFAIAQALPRPGSSRRVRGASLPFLLAMLATFAWSYTVQHEWLAAAVVVDGVLLACLGWAAAILVRKPADSVIEGVAIDVPVGLYLGWATISAVSHVTALGSWWLGTPADAGMPAAVGVAIGAGFLGVAMVKDLAVVATVGWSATVGYVWGLAWIADARLNGELAAPVVGWTALIAAGAVVATTAIGTVAAAIRRQRWERHVRERDGLED